MKMTIANAPIAALMGALTFTLAAPQALALDDAAQLKLGEIEYMANCASCHGPGGMGDGPVAEVLSTQPSDLTQISSQYSGIYPADEVYRVVSGQNMINPHGSREMPVWGPRYWQVAADRAASVPHDVDMQAMVHGRITALVQYIESMQSD
ncbi:c-type cytochrome [Salipiger sp. 1_MG-2023]|uniref:c-type cytochrome n=1 Tax=Salipiger sp. 1_MG-2023 TaxID=3062665 RepID=UPI0026E466D1|nr:c-type cytochrome [Salipiger sp. 1_MG-2023]MDO6587448.1 c-type cytochrome [Salipiger sp. 1_MG-2023]